MNYPFYFNEGFTPQSGIDTIAIWIHPWIINNHSVFYENGNNNDFINLRFKRENDQITGNTIRTNFFVDIQAEEINPYDDVLDQILNILCFLVENRILHNPKKIDLCNIKGFFYTNFDRLFALDALDFYHDLRNEDVRLLGKLNKNYPNTRYSSRVRGNPSILKVYSRQERLKQKRNISYEKIENIEYTTRIEFSLRRGTCEYLNAMNLTGSYENIFFKYLPFLARKWREYRYEIVEVLERNILYAHNLRQIIAVSRQRIPQYELHNTPKKPIPFKSAKKNELDYNFMAVYYSRA